MFRHKLQAALFPFVCGALAGPALAQSGGDLGGPLVSGVCLFSRDALFANSMVGKSAFARFQQLESEADAELAKMRAPIEPEIQDLQASADSLSAPQRAAREAALNAKLQPIQARATHLRRELDATRAKLLDRISGEMLPVVSDVYKEKGCGLLIDRASVVGGNMGNDLTGAVIQRLDFKTQSITFNRETLPSMLSSEPPVP